MRTSYVFSETPLQVDVSRRCAGRTCFDVCCDLTPYETSRSLELKPDRENVTRSGARTHIQPNCCCSATMLLWSVARKCCSSKLSSTCCLRNMKGTARWLRYGVGEQSTMRITKHDTTQSERTLVIDTSSLEAVCVKPKESRTCHPCIDCVTSCVVLLVLHAHHCTRTSRMWNQITVEGCLTFPVNLR